MRGPRRPLGRAALVVAGCGCCGGDRIAGRRCRGAAPAAGRPRRVFAVADRVRPGSRLHRTGQGHAGRAGHRGRLAGAGVPPPRRGHRPRGVGRAGRGIHLHSGDLGPAAGRGRGGRRRRTPVARLRGRGANRGRGRALRRGALRRGAQPLAERASSSLACNRPAGCGYGRGVTPASGVPPGRWGAGLHLHHGLFADAGGLAACFGLAGLPVPWRGLLFAYTAGQLAGGSFRCPAGSAVWKAACSGRSRSPAPRPQVRQPQSSSTG